MTVKFQGSKTFRKQLCNVVRVTAVFNSWFLKQGTDDVDNWGHIGVKRPHEKGHKIPDSYFVLWTVVIYHLNLL